MKFKKILLTVCMVSFMCITGCQTSEKTPKEVLADAFVKFGEIKSYLYHSECEEDGEYYQKVYNEVSSVTVKNGKKYQSYFNTDTIDGKYYSIYLFDSNVNVTKYMELNAEDYGMESARLEQSDVWELDDNLNIFEGYKYLIDSKNAKDYEFSMQENEEGQTEIVINEIYSEDVKNKRYSYLEYDGRSIEYVTSKIIFTIDESGNIIKLRDEFYKKFQNDDKEYYTIADVKFTDFNKPNVNTEKFDEIFMDMSNYSEGDYISLK